MDSARLRLGPRDTFRILWPYTRGKFTEQLSSIWFIVAYLTAFQLFVLGLPIVHAGMIAAGILVVAVGLMFFMEGLRLGLMPLGEIIGRTLPERSRLPTILGFAFLLGIGATFAEPAIAVLKAAGSGVQPAEAPLLYSLLNEFSQELVGSVGVGVGLAVLLGVLRFFFDWPLKWLALPSVSIVLVLSVVYAQSPALNDVLGLAWDCGAVTTGPVTVPLVLALGIGVCRVVTNSPGGTSSGFGIVTLASLFPILAVLLLAGYHFQAQDFYGAPNYAGRTIAPAAQAQPGRSAVAVTEHGFSKTDFDRFRATGELPKGATLSVSGGDAQLVDGRIVVTQPEITIGKRLRDAAPWVTGNSWDSRLSIADSLRSAGLDALRAIVPLCVFLLLVLYGLLRTRLDQATDVAVGLGFALVGMALFSLGIALGLTPLGGQLVGNVPLAFAAGTPWGLTATTGPLFDPDSGKLVAIAFAFFLGYGATLAEPALNALGDTVERITVGAFRKRLLMQSVAFGVGLGIAAGIIKMAYGLPLLTLLLPAYGVVLVLTLLAPSNFVNFSWDSAGVTTGPITVPLVLAMGLGIGGSLPSVSDGFGILALASVGPILSVLTVGLYTNRSVRREAQEASGGSAYLTTERS
ncbi:MAG: DUF1538 domain-containing protein [Pseudomonadota bacterium]